MSRWHILIWLTLLFLLQAASLASPAPRALNADQRSRLRTRLERIFYEQDLLIRNQKVDRADLRQQEREFRTLKVFERIPFRDDYPGIQESLTTSAREKKLKVSGFSPLPRSRKNPPNVPFTWVTDKSPSFRLSNEQLVEQLPFKIEVRGDRPTIEAWIRSWPEDQLRLTRVDSLSPRKGGGDRWALRGHAFRFREVKFPTLEPRDPFEILPAWAQEDPNHFSHLEPVLWSFVARTRAITSQARPLYRTREEMQLNAARISFFISLAVPRS
jgi:hypothetical protein